VERLAGIRVEPAALNLRGPRDSRRFVVHGTTQDGLSVDVTRSAIVEVKGDAVVLKEGFVEPVRNGEAELRITAGGQEARLPVMVMEQDRPTRVSFVTDIMPLLGKNGCNAGTCHGAARGRNGFKLSLRGYDPGFDYEQIVEDLAGRRIDRKEPANSLVLLKPTQVVPHEGKLLFDEDSSHYRLLRQWIADGCISDVGKTQRVARIEVFPRAPVLHKLGTEQQMIVKAWYPDGSSRDVTRDAIYSSSADSIVAVTGDGLVRGLRKGESAIVVRYEGQFAVNPVSVLITDPNYRWSNQPAYNYIDELVYRRHQRLQLLPSEVCSDADFFRRVSLDLIGVPPAPEEVRVFLADNRESAVKRRDLVDKLLARPEYVDFQTLRLADLMQVNRKVLGEAPMLAFYKYLRQQVAADRPWNELASELLAAPAAPDSPSSFYYRISSTPGQAVETTTHLFLGVRFNCNKCHDHPFERWTWNDYYHLAAFFSDKPDVLHPRSKAAMAPRFPFQLAGIEFKETTGGRKQQLAAWLTSPQNPYFARAMANRLWADLLGHGIIEPVDDIRAGNPPSNPELLDALAADFVKNKFSIKHLLRTIVNSRTYQLSLEPNQTNRDGAGNFARARPRRLTAEQLLDSLRMATGTKNQFAGLPLGMRAAQLPDPMSGNDGFLAQFGRPVRESPCACERRNEMSLEQALALINGPTLSGAVADPQGRIAALIKDKVTDRRLVEEIYLAVLGRLPTEDEATLCIKEGLSRFPNRQEAAQDLMWALLNTSGFLFNR
jgi:hypothetical protein